MKAMTVKEAIEQMRALVASGQVGEDAWVVIEGCDCNGYADAVEVNGAFLPEVTEYDDGEYVQAHRAPGPAVYLRRMGNRR